MSTVSIRIPDSARADREAFLRVMEKVTDAAPEESDRLPQ